MMLAEQARGFGEQTLVSVEQRGTDSAARHAAGASRVPTHTVTAHTAVAAGAAAGRAAATCPTVTTRTMAGEHTATAITAARSTAAGCTATTAFATAFTTEQAKTSRLATDFAAATTIATSSHGLRRAILTRWSNLRARLGTRGKVAIGDRSAVRGNCPVAVTRAVATQKPVASGSSAYDGSAGPAMCDVRMATATSVVMTKTGTV